MTREDLLEAVDVIDWKKYDSAYGRWRDIPASFRYLLGYEPEPTRVGGWLRTTRGARISSRLDAISILANELEHQGDTYSAAFPAISILCDLLPHLGSSEKVAVVELLINIAFPFADGLELYEEASWWDHDFYRLLEGYSDCFLPLLNDRATWVVGCYALAWFPRVGGTAISKLREISEVGDVEQIMTALLARGLLGDSILVRDSGLGVRIRRVSAIAKAYGSGACEECLEVFAEMSAHVVPGTAMQQSEWRGPWGRHLMWTAIGYLQRTDSPTRKRFLEMAVQGGMTEFVSTPLGPDVCEDLRPWLSLSGVPI